MPKSTVSSPSTRSPASPKNDIREHMIQNIKKDYWAPLEQRHLPGAWEALEAGYGDPRRAYHTWGHIADLLHKLDRFSHLAVRKDILATAFFWHDAVYVTCGDDGVERPDEQNVRESAELFRRYASTSAADVDAVTDLIMATANHTGATPQKEHYDGFGGDFDLFLDLDLSSLGAPWPEFLANFENIRFECRQIPELVFLSSRIRGLDGFARLGANLFRRVETRKEWGDAAVSNLACWVGELTRRAHSDRTDSFGR